MTLENQQSADDPVDDALDSLGLDAEDAANEDDTPRDDDEDGDEDGQPDETDDEDGEEDDPSDDDDESGDDEPKDDGKAKGRPRVQKRIDQLTRAKGDAERERDYWKSLYESNRTNGGQQTRQPTQQEYQQGEAQGFSREQVEAWVTQAANEKVAQAEFNQKAEAVRNKLTDGGAVEELNRLSNPAITQFHPEAVEALHDTRYPAQVAKAIANDEGLLNKFRSANPAGQAALIARIDGRLEARASQRRPEKKTAKTPQVRGKSRPPEKHPDDMDQAEYEAWTKKQGW